MIDPQIFVKMLSDFGINFYAGVPDSLLSELCNCLSDNLDESHYLVCANEGSAIALATGHYLATGAPGAVYMQNSGLGNALNPLLSLADPEVYAIPMLLIIGFRGEPGIKDEPQHLKQGRVQNALLDAAEIPYRVLDNESLDYPLLIREMLDLAILRSGPTALVIRKGCFQNYRIPPCPVPQSSALLRESALEIILDHFGKELIISTTGKCSREVFEIRRRQAVPCGDFLTVGSMGHASSIALGIALEKPDRGVICLDGDGALIMHMGSLAVIGKHHPPNFIHIVLNNHCHESVGGQPTPSERLDLKLLAQATGYSRYLFADDTSSLETALEECRQHFACTLLEVLINPGSREDLGRPSSSPIDNKQEFMHLIGEAKLYR